MKVSEQQLLLLLTICRESLRLNGFFSVPNQTRKDLYEEIMKQQDDTLVEVSSE